MALNGNTGWVNGGPYNSFGIYLEWSATPNIEGNYSDVTATVSLRSNNSSSWFQRDTDIWININGDSSRNVISLLLLNPGATRVGVWSRTVRVPHDSNGGKAFAYSASASNPTIGTLSAGSTGGLTAIPRVSTMTWDSSTFPHMYGKETAMNVSSASGSFYHSIEVRARGAMLGTVVSNRQGGGRIAFTIPRDWANRAGDTVLESVSFRLITHTKPGSYGGDSLIGFRDYSGQVSVPPDMVPSISSVSYSDQNATIRDITGSDQILVDGFSVPRMNVQAQGSYSSIITEYKFEVGGATITNNGYTTDISLKTYSVGTGSVNVKVTVTDTRGRTATTNKTLDVRPYSAPKITNFSASRIEAPDKTKTTIRVTKAVSVSSIKNDSTEKNTYTVVTRVKKASDTAWKTLDPEYNVSATLDLTGYSVTDSYDIEVTVTDRISSGTPFVVKGNVSTDTVLIHAYKDIGLGIGKYYEEGHGGVDIKDMIYMMGRSLLDTFYPVGSIYQSTSSTSPSTFMGGTWERFAKGQVLVGVNEGDADFNAPGKTGGEKTHKLDTSASKATNETGATSTAKQGMTNDGLNTSARFAGRVSVMLDLYQEANPHNNIQPYVTVYTWRRTA